MEDLNDIQMKEIKYNRLIDDEYDIELDYDTDSEPEYKSCTETETDSESEEVVNYINKNSLLDYYIYIPLADYLIDSSYKNRLAPDMITFLSMISTLFGLFMLINSHTYLASIFYFFGYVLNCANDNLMSKYSVAFDFNSNIISNGLFIIYLTLCHQNIVSIFILHVLLVVAGINFSLLEAYHSYQMTNSINFLQVKEQEYDNDLVLSYKFYLYCYRNIYAVYEQFGSIDIDDIIRYIRIFKNFGQGTLVTYNIFLILTLDTNNSIGISSLIFIVSFPIIRLVEDKLYRLNRLYIIFIAAISILTAIHSQNIFNFYVAIYIFTLYLQN